MRVCLVGSCGMSGVGGRGVRCVALKVWLPCCRTVRGIECPLVCFVIGGQLTRVARY